MKRVTIMRGPSGCGKSTFLEKHYPNALVISADDFWLAKCKDQQAPCARPPFPITCKKGVWYEYLFDPAKLAEAHSRCFAGFLDALSQGIDTIVVDNTNIFIWQYMPYQKAALLAGYSVEVVEWVPKTIDDIKLCAKRNRHRVPIEVVAKMCLDFEPSNDPATNVMTIRES